MNFTKLSALTLSFFFLASSASAAPAKSLGDLNLVKAPQTLPFHVQSGNKIFFTRTTPDLGSELWVTDGTAAGTSLVKDIVPGTGGSEPSNFVSTKIAGQPGAYFSARTEASGRELWVTDGTELGTFMLKDIYPGNSSSVSSDISEGYPIVSVPESPYVFFAADNGVNGTEFWVSDGTPAGTKLAADIRPGASSSNPRDFKFFPGYPSGVFFSASTAAAGEELFFGNDVSFSIVHDLNAGAADSNPGEAFLTSAALVYPAETAANGRELWSSDLVTPTLLADTVPGSATSYIASPMQISTDQILYGSIGQVGSSVSISLMSTNGTPAGTSVVAALDCLPGGITPLITGINLKVSEVLNGHALFPCYNVETLRTALWVSDGTAGSTHVLKDFVSAPTTYLGDSFSMQRGNNRIIFMANDGNNGLEPWTTDGTSAGTSLLMDLNPERRARSISLWLL
jgi:ELWxxDGT repeat protein